MQANSGDPDQTPHSVASDLGLRYLPMSHIMDASGRAKNWQKVAYLRRNPSPSVKWKTIALMIWQVVEVSWIAGITFSKRGNGVKIWQKLHFKKWNCEFLESICSNRYTKPAKKDWKMIIEFYIILTWLYHGVKVRNEMSLFLGENRWFL